MRSIFGVIVVLQEPAVVLLLCCFLTCTAGETGWPDISSFSSVLLAILWSYIKKDHSNSKFIPGSLQFSTSCKYLVSKHSV
jgi:hypothetical protein